MEKKAVYIVSNSNTVNIKLIKDETEREKAEVSFKSGGLAIGIENAIPDDGYQKAHWQAVLQSPGPETTSKEQEETAKKKEMMLSALRDWEENQDIPKGSNNFVFIDQDSYKDFQQGATNGIIWPLLHGMPEKVPADRDLNMLTPTNWEFAESLLEKINNDIRNPEKPEITDYNSVVLWAHDYQVFRVAAMLKQAISEQNQTYQNTNPEKVIEGDITTSFFHHETWPNLMPGHPPEGETVNGKVYLGENTAVNERFQEILEDLTQVDSIGFHTSKDAENFVNTMKNFGIDVDLQMLKDKTYVNPIGIPRQRIEKQLLEALPVLKKGLENTIERNTPFYTNLKAQSEALKTVIDNTVDLELRNSLQQSNNRIIDGDASLHDYQTVMTKTYFDPEKIHIASVSRFDYTKGISEFLNAYKDFLQNKKNEDPGKNPGDTYQFNLVTSPGRSSPIPAYQEYEKEARQQINELQEEFPGALYHYEKGINNPELPLFNAMTDISVAASLQDGYILAIGEMIDARNRVLEHDEVDTLLPGYRATGSIVSNGAGISEDLGGPKRLSNYDSLAIIEPTIEQMKEALSDQIEKVEALRSKGIDGPEFTYNKGELKKMCESITDSDQSFGVIAFNKISETIEERKGETRETGSALELAGLAVSPPSRGVQREIRQRNALTGTGKRMRLG